MTGDLTPTNNALLIIFLLSSEAETLLLSTDWAYQIGAKRAKTCTQRLHIPIELPFCMPHLAVGHEIKISFLPPTPFSPPPPHRPHEVRPESLLVGVVGDDWRQRLPEVLPGPEDGARARGEPPLVQVAHVEGDTGAAELLLAWTACKSLSNPNQYLYCYVHTHSRWRH